jgi:hypothetical protein
MHIGSKNVISNLRSVLDLQFQNLRFKNSDFIAYDLKTLFLKT